MRLWPLVVIAAGLPGLASATPPELADQLTDWRRIQALTPLGLASERGLLVLDTHDDRAELRELPLDGDLDLTTGHTLVDTLPDDLAEPRTAVWSPRHASWWVELDDGTVHWLDPDRGRLVAVSGDTARPHRPALSTDADALLWLQTDAQTCLWRAGLDIDGRLDTPIRIVCDGDAALGDRQLDLRQRPAFAPDPDSVLVTLRTPGATPRAELTRLTPTDGGLALTTLSPGNGHQVTSRAVGWLDPTHLLAVADDRGADTLERVELDDRGCVLERHPLTDAELDVRVLSMSGDDDTVFVAHRSGLHSRLQVLDARTGTVLAETTVAGQASWLGHSGPGGALLRTSAMQSPLTVLEVDRDGSELRVHERGGLPDALEAGLVHCDVGVVSIDVPELDGAPARTMEALLMMPATGEASVGVVRAFYGGLDRYSVVDDLLCARGVALLSPAVRGSLGRGNAYAALDDGDLGGREIVELDLAGRALAERLELAPDRIGLIGTSRGGYAVLQALTRTPHDHDDLRFDFGFGVAVSPITDLEAYATESPWWTRIEAGTNVEQLRARSPVHAATTLTAPVVLLHGTGDAIVSVEHSRRFAAAADGEQVTLIELDGGHGLPDDEALARWVELIAGRGLAVSR